MEPFPITPHAPAGPKPGHEGVPSPRLHTQGHVVTNRTTISIGEDEEENDRRHDDPQDEERDENDSEYHECDTSVRPFDDTRELEARQPYRSWQLELTRDGAPALYPGDPVLDPLDRDLCAGLDRISIEAFRASPMQGTLELIADLPRRPVAD